MDKRVFQVAALLGASGACALVLQVAWLRELRLVFGGSTAASAAVLAIFMGGLGLGGAILGKRADASPSPLGLYATLELLVAAMAALTPFLLIFVREIYIALGGSMAMGLTNATLVRLALSALVLGFPTFLMGGTLPAAARSVESREDVGRNAVAVLYGVNTLGAAAGAFIATFYCLEVFGTRLTLWLACLLNALVGMTARVLARRAAPERSVAPGEGEERAAAISEAVEVPAPAAPAFYVLGAAAVVGFVFLLMELVWYRMLSPLLGGSTYTFGLILAVALFGLGLGGALYALVGRRRPATIEVFAATVGLEALFMAIPFALGDRLAVLAEVLRELSSMGFPGHVFGWTVITSAVILPAAVVSGYQFPLLIALLGQGRENVGRHTGFAYAANTGGSILGSLAGGFGALPLLTAVGTWRAVVILLAALGGAALAVSARRRRPSLHFAVPLLCASIAVFLVMYSLGPTAAWRHSGIGAGRGFLDTSTPNDLKKSILDQRRHIIWEAEGIESSVALEAISGLSFIINGKNDGNAIRDASTQVMSGLLCALAHPEPKRSFVLGLGTGSTAGWLAAVESMERVDVVELEPATIEMARRSAAVNHDALNNSKVNVIEGDGRELLLTAPGQYDLIFSEPSNPFRAGIASLYTQEFYEAVASRLAEGGLFAQWVQAYEIDVQTVRTIYATLASVFPYVETWQTNPLDMILVCSMEPIVYSQPELNRRIREEPYASALLHTWKVTDQEGFFSRYVANAELPKIVAAQEKGRLNTDDRTLVEFGFARTVGNKGSFSVNDLRRAAVENNAHRPTLTDVEGLGAYKGEQDWQYSEEQRLQMAALADISERELEDLAPGPRHRAEALACFVEGDLEGVLTAWQAQERGARSPIEVALVAEALAEAGDDQAFAYAARLRDWSPVEADAVLARLAYAQGRTEHAVGLLEKTFTGLRGDPWPMSLLMDRALRLAQAMAKEDPGLAPRLLAAIGEPFAVYLLENFRMELTVELASRIGYAEAAPYIEAFEPNVLWTEEFLSFRARCYAEVGHPKAALAERQFAEFVRGGAKGFSETLELRAN